MCTQVASVTPSLPPWGNVSIAKRNSIPYTSTQAALISPSYSRWENELYRSNSILCSRYPSLMLLWLLCHRNAFSYMCPQAIITSQSHDTRESPPLLVDPENTTYSHRPLGASSHVPLARSPAHLETLHDLFFMLWKPYQRSLNFIPIWTTLWYRGIFLGITPPIIISSELHSDMNYPLVLRDILGYLLHPLSFHQNFIPTWTTLWYWVIFFTSSYLNWFMAEEFAPYRFL